MTVMEERLAPTGRASRAGWGLAACAGVVAAGAMASAVLGARAGTGPFMERSWPFVVLGVSVGVVVVLISVAKLHAFLALVAAAASAGLMSAVGSLPDEAKYGHWVAAVEGTGAAFGSTAGSIGIVIALASVIGMALTESGAADRIVRRFLDAFGPSRAGLALLLATYVVSIPIFFDTIFLLLVPLARAMWRRTRRDYVLYLMAICCAGCITHTMVIPHPGPAAAANSLRIDAGLSILVGLGTGLVPLAAGWLACHWANRRMRLEPGAMEAGEAEDSERSLPPLGWALLPIVAPLGLIWIASGMALIDAPSGVRRAAEFLGNRNVALAIGAAASVGVLMRQRGLSLEEVGRRLGPAMETAGIIILITSAGGAFGTMLRNAGIGRAIAEAAQGSNINLIVLAYAVAVVIRCAQGSVTVAMITAAAIMAPLAAGPLPYHPIYLFMAVGYGAMGVSWMNDSGFWVISRLGGMTEKQTLGSWTVLTGVLSVTGIAMTLILSRLLPMALP